MSEADGVLRPVRCPICGAPWSRVYKSGPPLDEGHHRIQYRRCLNPSCARPFQVIAEVIPPVPEPDRRGAS